MSWKVRHEGSPRTVDDVTPGQIAQGLEDGQWLPTDEVLGPGEANWSAIENHPVFAEVAEEPAPARARRDAPHRGLLLHGSHRRHGSLPFHGPIARYSAPPVGH